MTAAAPGSHETQLAREVRERFVAEIESIVAEMAEASEARLIQLVDQSATTREMQDRRDAMLDFQRLRAGWVDGTVKGWRRAMIPPTATARVRLEAGNFELIGEEVVENKILSSRLALTVLDKVSWELNDLRLRMQKLEDGNDLSSQDILRPEVTAQLMVEQWGAVGLSRDVWAKIQDIIQQHLVERLTVAYHQANEFLIERGVMPEIDLKPMVRRAVASPANKKSQDSSESQEDEGASPQQGDQSGGGAPGGHGGGGGRGGRAGGGAGNGAGGVFGGSGGSGGGGAGGGSASYGGGTGGGGGGSGSGGSGRPGVGGALGGGSAGGVASGRPGSQGAPTTSPGIMGAQGTGMGGGAGEETRMLTSSTPLARARQRAQGVIGQLKRMLGERLPDYNGGAHMTQASPGLAQAIVQAQAMAQATQIDHGGGADMVYDDAGVEQVAVAMRARTGELKKKATTEAEKATIEIVALMFQSILAEDRIPAPVRVWFARLQMPVLRVAISEPEFFGTLQHPARMLIDRMGSCVMGFDPAAINGSALEAEIKRVVQVIEQYPETGRRVFKLVYDEFQKFLEKFLTEKGATQRLVSVAQQVEQKETMAIQYTIEMRNMLNDMPVRDEIRNFLFKVWAEVLAIAAMKNGPQHPDTISLKKSAADLVWAASAKPNRNDRSRVIQDLPKLLQRLRQGMTLLGVVGAEQEAHIKSIGDTLADAFMSKTEVIPQARIEAMAKRLANLEDFVSEDGMGDLPLDAESIEMVVGIDASSIEVVADGGSKPSEAMMAWAQELQVGTWFTLDHNGKISRVQYAWCSDRKQLHLFASTDGRSYLIQVRRLAAYLQAGLLVPQEEEALTVRATRDALAKLDANPERLLN